MPSVTTSGTAANKEAAVVLQLEAKALIKLGEPRNVGLHGFLDTAAPSTSSDVSIQPVTHAGPLGACKMPTLFTWRFSDACCFIGAPDESQFFLLQEMPCQIPCASYNVRPLLGASSCSQQRVASLT